MRKMASNKNQSADAVGEQIATPAFSSSPVHQPTKSAPKKRKAHEANVEQYPTPESDSNGNKTKTPAVKKPRKKPAPKSLANTPGSLAPSESIEKTPSAADQHTSSKNAAVKKSRKRKADEATAVDGASQSPGAESQAPPKKKAKANQTDRTDATQAADGNSEATPAKKVKKAPTPKSTKKATRATPRKAATEASIKDDEDKKTMPPPPLPPATVTQAVANKIKQVRQCADEMGKGEGSKLDRDPENKALVSVPQSSLLAALMRMRMHYEMAMQQDTSVPDVEEAIVKRYKKQMTEVEVDYVTVDVAKRTEFENGIKEKIVRHGLEDVNLLEVELVMVEKDRLAQFSGSEFTKKEVEFDAERFKSVFEEIWERVQAEDGAAKTEEDVLGADADTTTAGDDETGNEGGEDVVLQASLPTEDANNDTVTGVTKAKTAEHEVKHDADEPDDADTIAVYNPNGETRPAKMDDEKHFGRRGVCPAPMHAV